MFLKNFTGISAAGCQLMGNKVVPKEATRLPPTGKGLSMDFGNVQGAHGVEWRSPEPLYLHPCLDEVDATSYVILY